MTTEEKLLNGEALTQEELEKCAWGEVGEMIEVIKGDMGRWTQSRTTIFKINDKLFAIRWWYGLTEYQEHEYDEQPYEVIKIRKTIIVDDYKRVEK